MAIDMNRMRARQTALKNKGGDGNNSFWRPQEGEQTIRIITPSDGDPFRDYWFHYEVGNEKGFLSPKRNFGEDCPLDSYVRALWKEGSEESKRRPRDWNRLGCYLYQACWRVFPRDEDYCSS